VDDEQGSEVPPLAPGEAPPVDAAEFEASFGESLAHALDLDTWTPGEDLTDLSDRLKREIEEAVRQEDSLRTRIRDVVFTAMILCVAVARGLTRRFTGLVPLP
jgi:hypothetical protein